MSMIKTFDAARRVSIPLVKIRTADQQATVAAIRDASEKHPVVQWDAVRGITKVNTNGEKALAEAKIEQAKTIQFVPAMLAAGRLPTGAVLCVHNAHRQLVSQEPASTAAAVQAVANLRDEFKVNFRMLVLMDTGGPAPTELTQDIVTMEHALPTTAELTALVTETCNSAKNMKPPTTEEISKAVDAVSGLSAFAAEQVIAMSLRPAGIDLDAVWERKREAIEQTRGMTVWRGGETFDDLIGLDNIKSHLRRRLKARTPIGCVLFLDEIDKVLANVEHDTSGVRMDQLRTLLTEMENNEWRGLIAVGVPGGGKSAIAKAFGNEAGVPTVAIDLGGMESKYVGESEANLRQAMEIVKAIGRGNAYVIATSNNASVMRPELQRRFTDGMWMFDLLSDDERAAALKLYVGKYELSKQQTAKLPDFDGWTGAEMRNLCRYAWDTGCTLVEAAQFIVPMARARSEAIEELRQYAQGRFLDSTRPGTYRYDPAPMARQVEQVRTPRPTRGIVLNDGEVARVKGES